MLTKLDSREKRAKAISWRYGASIAKADQSGNMWGYLWNLGDLFQKCVAYNILHDKTGRYGATIMSLCQDTAKHNGKVWHANQKAMNQAHWRKINHRAVTWFVKHLMRPMRDALDNRETFANKESKMSYVALPVISSEQYANVKSGTMYVPVRRTRTANGHYEWTLWYRGFKRQEMYESGVVSRLDAWYTISDNYNLYFAYTRQLNGLPWATWGGLQTFYREIRMLEPVHEKKPQCNNCCGWNSDYVLVGVYATSPWAKYDWDLEEIGDEYKYRWLVRNGKQVYVQH